MSKPRHPPISRATVVTAAISLLVGVSTTVVVAWLAAATSDLQRYYGETHRAAQPSDLPAYLRDIWPPPVRVSHRQLGGWAVTAEEITCCDDPDVFEREWTQGVPTPPRPSVMRLSFGWPMRAMYYEVPAHGGGRPSRAELQEFFTQFSSAAGFREGKRFPDWIPHASGSFRAIPLAVLPLGFAVNTVVLAGLFAAMVRGPGMLRRWRRRRRGLCARCGYARAGLAEGAPCPECGAAAT